MSGNEAGAAAADKSQRETGCKSETMSWRRALLQNGSVLTIVSRLRDGAMPFKGVGLQFHRSPSLVIV